MFEIGSSLREARLRQGLAFPEVEQATKIRGKYLRALEDEEFDVLPAQTYVKGFLRAYAEYLGLDGQLYVDEYNSRYVAGVEDEPLLRSRRVAQQRRRTVESRAVVLTLLGIAALVALVIVAWKSGGSTPPQNIPGLSTETKTAAPLHARTKKVHRRHRAAVAHVVLVGAHGSSLVTARLGGPRGRVLFQGSVLVGDRRVLSARQIWLQASTPEALTATVNGRVARLPRTGPSVVVITARGTRQLSSG